ncbi:MAG: tetratricopeptide repeat protein [Verrucomicrobiales bacterium]
MKRLLPTLLFLSIGQLIADDFSEQYYALSAAGDEAAIEKFLNEASTAEAENPNYYAVAGNYWWGQAGAVSVPAIKAGEYQLDPKDFSITDPKTGKKVGSIGQAGEVDPQIRERAIGILSEGARKFPQRADIAFGLAHVQKKIGNRKGYVATLTALLKQAKKDPAGLKWMDNAAMPEPPETYVPESVQAYSADLFNANSPATDAMCETLLSSVIDAFPDHPFAYNLKGALADANGKPEEALKMLETASKKAPKDTLILMNLAGAYAKVGKNAEAIAIYKKVSKLNVDPRTVAKAESALKRLEAGADKPK